MKLSIRKGFTLIEILIVVIILGILAAIVIPQFTNASNDAKVSSVQSTVSSVQAQLELYKFQNSATFNADLWKYLGTKYQSASGTLGPWIASPAINPFAGGTGVTYAGVAASGTPPTAGPGWYYDTAANKFYGNCLGTWFPQQ